MPDQRYDPYLFILPLAHRFKKYKCISQYPNIPGGLCVYLPLKTTARVRRHGFLLQPHRQQILWALNNSWCRSIKETTQYPHWLHSRSLFHLFLSPNVITAPPNSLTVSPPGGGGLGVSSHRKRRTLVAPEMNLSLDHSEGSLLSDDFLDTPDDLDINVDDIDTPDESDSLEFITNGNELEWEGKNKDYQPNPVWLLLFQAP